MKLFFLILKDYLIYDNHIDFYNKFAGIMAMNNTIHQKQVSQVVKDFITDDMYNKRNTIISLLIKSRNYENQYLAYLLYDLLSNDSNGNIDTQEQTMLFDSFPWPLKQCFKQHPYYVQKAIEQQTQTNNKLHTHTHTLTATVPPRKHSQEQTSYPPTRAGEGGKTELAVVWVSVCVYEC